MQARELDWRALFPQLAEHPDTAALLDSAAVIKLAPDQLLFDKGSPCRAFLLVLKGSINVQLLGESGRMVTLYRVAAGDSCVLTTTCLLGDRDYPAIGVSESPGRALQLRGTEFHRGLDRSPAFRRFVFEGLGRRLADVIRRMDAVSFGSIDVRLANALCAASSSAGAVTRTHEALATELGTAREVVSRHLKRFEEAGWLKLRRGRIEIRDRQALATLRATKLM